jgi:hypothetical protein
MPCDLVEFILLLNMMEAAYLSGRLHSVTSQMTVILIFTTMRTQNLTSVMIGIMVKMSHIKNRFTHAAALVKPLYPNYRKSTNKALSVLLTIFSNAYEK